MLTMFRYRHSNSINGEGSWKKEAPHTTITVPTASEIWEYRLRLWTAIISIVILFTIFAVTLNQVFQDSKYHVLSFTLNANQGLSRTDEAQEGVKLKENKSSEFSSREDVFYIQDVILIPDEVLVMVRLPSASSRRLGHRSMVFCVYSDKITTQVNGIEYLQRQAAVRCELPQKGEQELSEGSESLKLQSLYLFDRDLNIHIKQISQTSLIRWDFLVYESFSTDTDVVLFAKGVNYQQGLNKATKYLRCVFNGTVMTTVTVSNQEVFRCMHPDEAYTSDLVGTKVTLRWHRKIIPSVAYYQLPRDQHPWSSRENEFEILCSCTMVSNVAKFLKEWMMYHSYLGVGHFFLYDNNSEDLLEETLGSLGGEFKVTRHPWPWIKTQEAGFSHCALLARSRCQWMLYTDVDEFFFSPQWLDALEDDTQSKKRPKKTRSRSKPSHLTEKPLQSLVMKRTNNMKIGQISIKCNNFGPSGLKVHPERGVTQGYTCREKAHQRHKSIVLLEALPPSLLNVIHHFQLERGYITEYMKLSKAVINHYKYQAWSEFKTKFRRRVSAYVVDWTDSRNLGSQDRTPGLGNQAVEPPQWEHRFCDVNDTALRDFTLKVFSTGSKMLWQL